MEYLCCQVADGRNFTVRGSKRPKILYSYTHCWQARATFHAGVEGVGSENGYLMKMQKIVIKTF